MCLAGVAVLAACPTNLNPRIAMGMRASAAQPRRMVFLSNCTGSSFFLFEVVPTLRTLFVFGINTGTKASFVDEVDISL